MASRPLGIAGSIEEELVGVGVARRCCAELQAAHCEGVGVEEFGVM